MTEMFTDGVRPGAELLRVFAVAALHCELGQAAATGARSRRALLASQPGCK
jgi:hypothetical protein